MPAADAPDRRHRVQDRLDEHAVVPLAPETAMFSGSPSAVTSRWYLLPALPRSVGVREAGHGRATSSGDRPACARTPPRAGADPARRSGVPNTAGSRAEGPPPSEREP